MWDIWIWMLNAGTVGIPVLIMSKLAVRRAESILHRAVKSANIGVSY